jgi:hypothetical protein
MDHLSDSFGRLSTSAREWTPQQTQTKPQQQKIDRSSSWEFDSELNASGVKDFVPGQGWSTQVQTASSNTDPPRRQPGELLVFLFPLSFGQGMLMSFLDALEHTMYVPSI